MASDPLADMQNLIGYQGLVGPNPYLQYQGMIPMAGFQTRSPFTGPVTMGPQDQLPTDAYGKPIQPPYGTTLNSSPPPAPPAPAPPPAPAAPDNSALMDYIRQQSQNIEGSPASLNQGGFGSGNGVLSNQALMNLRTNAIQMDQLQRQQQAGGMGQTAAPAAPAAPAVPTTGINRDQYLALLANPGPIQPVGANPPGPGQAQTGPVGSTNAIPAFLAANKGSNTSFINTLRQMQGSPA